LQTLPHWHWQCQWHFSYCNLNGTQAADFFVLYRLLYAVLLVVVIPRFHARLLVLVAVMAPPCRKGTVAGARDVPVGPSALLACTVLQ